MNEILASIKEMVAEVLPVAIKNIRLPQRPVSPFEMKRREFLNLRRNKAARLREEHASELDMYSLIAEARQTLPSERFEGNGTFSSSSRFSTLTSAAQRPEAPFGALEQFSSSGLVTLLEEKSTTNQDIEQSFFEFSDLGTAGESNLEAPKSDFRPRFLLDPSLLKDYPGEALDSSIIAAIETECRKLFYELPDDVSFNLTSSKTVTEETRTVLRIVPGKNVPLEGFNRLAERLEERIRSRLANLVDPLTSTATEKIGKFIDEFSVRIDLHFVGNWLTTQDFESFRTERFRVIIDALNKKTSNRETLSLDDFNKIKSVLSGNSRHDILEDVLSCLTEELHTRKAVLGIDCLKELYSDEEELPENVQMDKPAAFDISALILEAYRAIVLNEYEISHNSLRQSFLSKKISYAEFAKETRRLQQDVSQLWQL